MSAPDPARQTSRDPRDSQLDPALDPTLGAALVRLARAAIAARLGVPDESGKSNAPDDADLAPPPEVAAPGASFVTLTRHGALRGCIGTLEAHRPLADDVRHNACAAAFGDPRFPPLSAREWPDVAVEISVLTPAEAFPVIDEADACRQLVPFRDGVILACDGRRATFLPQVWTQLPAPRDFLAQLKRKAGLPADFWAPHLRLSRYRVRHWPAAS